MKSKYTGPERREKPRPNSSFQKLMDVSYDASRRLDFRMDLQELISRGRFIFSGAPERLKLFALVDGRRTAKEMASRLKGRHVNNIHRDLRLLCDIGLIQERKKDGAIQKKDGFTLYEKTPLARAVAVSYFSGPRKVNKPKLPAPPAKDKGKRPKPLPVPSENEILDMCKKGEDQTLEFKSAGTDVRKISKEIVAMLNTRDGGIIFYGVDDDRTVHNPYVYTYDPADDGPEVVIIRRIQDAY